MGTLRELSEEYLQAAARLRVALEDALARQEAAGPEEQAALEGDIRLLRQMLIQTREVGALARHYSGLPVWGIAGKLEVQGCTVTRTRQRGEQNLRRLVGVMDRRELSAQGWQATCRELANTYSLGLGTVYKILGGLQPEPDGLTLLQREIRARRAAGRSTASIARELGMSPNAVRRAIRR